MYFRLLILVSILPSIAFANSTASDCSGECLNGGQDFGNEVVTSQVVTVTLYLDNDLFTGSHRDQDYTGGFALAFSGAKASKHPFSIDKSLGFINKTIDIDALNTQKDLAFNSCEIGLTAFTPIDITLPTPILDDRPYASLMYLSNTRHDIDLKKQESWVSTLTIGAIGLDLAGNIQNTIHSVTGSEHAQGWDNQISRGGEPTFRYALSRQKHIDTGSPYMQLSVSSGASIGYITDASLGFSMRLGRLRTPWWSLDEDSGKYGAKSHAEMPTSRRLDELYVIAGANIQLRAYNAFLEGQFRDSPVSYSTSEVRHLVYDGWMGLAYELDYGLRFSYVIRHQSSEIDGGNGDRSFNYGALIASFRL